MQDPTYVLLYVANVPASEKFYADLLGKKPVESSPTFSLFVLSNGDRFLLRYWTGHSVRGTSCTRSPQGSRDGKP